MSPGCSSYVCLLKGQSDSVLLDYGMTLATLLVSDNRFINLHSDAETKNMHVVISESLLLHCGVTE